jgi:hypothetical protein
MKAAFMTKDFKPKACRERWNNHLDPRLRKIPWTDEEDLLLLKAECEVGLKWGAITKILTGRSDHSIKNRSKSL